MKIYRWQKDIGYDGPVAVGTDETVCVKALRVSGEFVVGSQGGDVRFESMQDLTAKVKDLIEHKKLCSKIRAYTVQVPLPGVPTYVVALLPSNQNETAEDVCIQHESFLNLAQDAGLKVLSLGSDGAATEMLAQLLLTSKAINYIEFSRPQAGIHIKIPLFGSNPTPLVIVQDPKHARKTGANQLLSGARLLAFGKYYINIGHMVLLMQDENSSLYQKDVFNIDRQDDGRAYRSLNNDTLELALQHPECTGLAVYLFIIGELVDAWLSNSASHEERILSSHTADVFLKRWKAFLKEQYDDTDGLMSLDRNGISHPAWKIFSQLASSLVALIISHREHFPDAPFVPWKHGTEACEHIFGWMRVILPKFTMLDARQMMPKIFTIIRRIMLKRIKMPKSEHIHAGYNLSFSDEPASLEQAKLLKIFPSDQRIHSIMALAEKRAQTLIEFTGMQVVSRAKPTPSDHQHNPDESHIDEDHSVSVGITKRYDIVYQEDENDPQLGASLHAAASITQERHNLDCDLDSLDDVTIESVELNANRMSISSLLNPKADTQVFQSLMLIDLRRTQPQSWI
ncbi:uncharacterized protein MELLADRAFT_94558 [Melampsora larici-populina 98AG31]|uniref:Uncharacterized protein n=1 Tax=Melampsora larici-populina (strain 98AG31 / pathotype 3-4-7) TaxID=747676 RepID=F4RBV3_MELLP|nr:uncharacterized protein MELLADRAFT_94558 [Melampsora larici-populina 98AG31]EGG10172.1 hypothetical protein MELLADRAFT_94558 [Melampsora larici-populina 98AG31]